MKHKVSDLEGALLDAAVALCEGKWSAESIRAIAEHPGKWRPSLDWSFAGPIIERERIQLISPDDLQFGVCHSDIVEWIAYIEVRREFDDPGLEYECTGQTPLIAAMRAFVASKFGDEVELP